MSRRRKPVGLILVGLERREEIQSPARTYWNLPVSAVFVYSTKTYGGTRWYEYYWVPEDAVLQRIRVTDRGMILPDTFPALAFKVGEAEEQLIMNILKREKGKA